MKKLHAIFSILLWTLSASAQTRRTESPVVKMALPEGNGAWIVRIVTTGGFTGRGEGDWAISSMGEIICALVRCPDSFAIAEIQPLVEVIGAANFPALALSPSGLCSDCITRVLTIAHRDAMGVLHTYTATWGDTAAEKLPAEVRRVYEAVLSLQIPR